MTPTLTAPTRTDGTDRRTRKVAGAFTLVELLVMVSILGLFVVIAQGNLLGALRKSRFDGQVQTFISVMQRAAEAAAEGGGRYEVIVNLSEQSIPAAPDQRHEPLGGAR